MKYKVRSLDVLSVAKLMACIHGCLGILVAILCLLFGMVGIALAPKQQALAMVPMMIVGLLAPFFYAGTRFVMGALGS